MAEKDTDRVFDNARACQSLWQGQSMSEALAGTELVWGPGKDRACQSLWQGQSLLEAPWEGQSLAESLTRTKLVRVFNKDRACQILWQGQSLSEALGRTENVTDRGLSLMLPWSKFSNLVKTLPAAFYMMYPIFYIALNLVKYLEWCVMLPTLIKKN